MEAVFSGSLCGKSSEDDEGPEITALMSVCDKGIPRIVPAPGGGLYKHKDELTDGELRQAARG